MGPGTVDRGAVLVYGDQVKVLAPPTSLDIVLADNKLIVSGYIEIVVRSNINKYTGTATHMTWRWRDTRLNALFCKLT